MRNPFLAVTLLTFTATLNAATYDLSSGWSNTNNPNGPWSYNEGSTPLPLVPNFNAAATAWSATCNQPAWAPSNSAGNFLPVWFKPNACVQPFFSGDPNNSQAPNILPGDIVVHTNDPSNGNLSRGPANVTFTVPASASQDVYTIQGSLWNAALDHPDRPQDWRLLLNGTTLASGTLNGTISRSRAQTFSVVQNLTAGDRVQLQIAPNPQSAGGAGYVVGLQFTLTPANVPIVLPQLAFGGGWYTALYFTNTTTSSTSFTVNFTRDDGTALVIPAFGGFSITVNLAARGTALVEAANVGPLTQGYASATLPSGVKGYGVFRQSIAGFNDQEAVVPVSGTTASTSTLVFDDTRNTTGVAVINLSSISGVVTAVARDSAGNILGTGTLPLGANGKKALFLRDLIPAVIGAVGSVDFTVPIGNLAVLGLRFNGIAFTSIPTSDK